MKWRSSGGAADQVVAEFGLDNVAVLADRETERRLVEFRNHHAAPEGAEVAALLARRTIGMRAGERGEIGAGLQLGLERLNLAFRIRLGTVGGGSHGTSVHQANMRGADFIGHDWCSLCRWLGRSEERGVGREGCCTSRSWWLADTYKKKNN